MIIISDLVGESIDQEERTEYGLFPNVQGFVSGRFYRIGKGGYVIYLTTTDAEFVCVNADSLGVEILRYYFEHHAEIAQTRERYEQRWQIIDYDDLGMPITKYEVSRVKRSIGCYGCGGSCALLGLAAMAFYETERVIGDWSGTRTSPWITGTKITISTLFGFAIGAYAGNYMDINKAVSVIKAARRPRLLQKR